MASNVNEMRNRKIKTFNKIKAFDENSTNIYCPSLIDYYPSRSKELKSLNLSDFIRFWEITRQMSKNDEDCYKLVLNLFLKKVCY